MKSSHANQIAPELFSKLTNINQYVILSDVYRTNYTNPDELYDLPEGVYPLKTFKSSHVKGIHWINGKEFSPAHFMTTTAGLPARAIMHAEINGLTAV